jgi:hypothetical protein
MERFGGWGGLWVWHTAKKTGGTIYAVPSEQFDNLAVVVAGAIK